jgi:hypothetical protein
VVIVIAYLGIALILAGVIRLLIKLLDKIIPARDPIDTLAGTYMIPREKAEELVNKLKRIERC